jgi:hypothetical protein
MGVVRDGRGRIIGTVDASAHVIDVDGKRLGWARERAIFAEPTGSGELNQVGTITFDGQILAVVDGRPDRTENNVLLGRAIDMGDGIAQIFSASGGYVGTVETGVRRSIPWDQELFTWIHGGAAGFFLLLAYERHMMSTEPRPVDSQFGGQPYRSEWLAQGRLTQPTESTPVPLNPIAAPLPLKVFVCYAHEDYVRAEEMYRWLQRVGIKPWMDKKDVPAGAEWRFELVKAVKSCDVCLVLVSRHFGKIGFVQKEIRIVLSAAEEQPPGALFLMPVRLDDCDMHERIEAFGVQWIDLFASEPATELLRSLQIRAKSLGRVLPEEPPQL